MVIFLFYSVFYCFSFLLYYLSLCVLFWLKQVLYNQNQAISSEMKMKMVADMAKGLAYLHSKSIIHRDVKSSNMVRTSHYFTSHKIEKKFRFSFRIWMFDFEFWFQILISNFDFKFWFQILISNLDFEFRFRI